MSNTSRTSQHKDAAMRPFSPVSVVFPRSQPRITTVLSLSRSWGSLLGCRVLLYVLARVFQDVSRRLVGSGSRVSAD